MIFKTKAKEIFFFIASFLILDFSLMSQESHAKSQAYTMETLPKNGLNVDWPVLNDRQYFTYKGMNARVMTLRSIMRFDCHKLTTFYGQDPQLALNHLELFILTQLALRGIDIQTMGHANRETLALSEIAKRLRQFGRIKETTDLFEKPHIVPTIAGLCQILAEDKEDLLRQKYHIRHQWDRYKINNES